MWHLPGDKPCEAHPRDEWKVQFERGIGGCSAHMPVPAPVVLL